MKIRIYIIALFTLLSTSCNEWLKVIPENEIVEGDLYAEATGFHNVLNGLYKNMAKPEAYGESLTYGLVDVMADIYYVYRIDGYGDGITNYSPLYRIATYDYDYNSSVVSLIDNVWESNYKTIANANNLIFNIQKAENSIFRFGEEEKNMILGEALAVRAMCHFDIARLFAPSMKVAPNEKVIHYSVESDVSKPGFITDAKSTEDIFKLVEADLLEAKDYICAYDTVSVDRAELLGYYRFIYPNGVDAVDLFYQTRGYRINAIAVNALLARLYNYWGKHELAMEYANKVINFSYTEDGEKEVMLSFSGGWSIAKDRKFEKGLIFALSYPNLRTDYQVHANPDGNDPLTLKHYEDLFVDYEFADGGDYRSDHLISISSSYYKEAYPLKNIAHPDDDAVIERAADMVPVIRLSEMYFILADSYAAAGNFAKAQESINIVREGRNCSVVDLGITDMDSYLDIYFKEFHREFFQEGQLFYQYKKYNELITTKMVTDNFVLPVPDSQSI